MKGRSSCSLTSFTIEAAQNVNLILLLKHKLLEYSVFYNSCYSIAQFNTRYTADYYENVLN